MKIANADKLKKHFESVVDVHLFTVPTILTIIDTFSSEVSDSTGWIPVTTSDPTPEQIEEIAKSFSEVREYPQDFWQYTCTLPENEQEVLITDKWGDVALVTFYADDDGFYFEGFEDRGDVVAWMPLPKPYSIGGDKP